MAAAANAIRTALGRMGLEQVACTYLVDGQGMNDLEEFAFLKDDDVENLCKSIRRPGGTLPNPNAAAAGQPPTIPNPGIPVSLRAENNLKLMCYFLRYKQQTSRALAPDEIVLENIRAMREHKEYEENHKDVEAPEINTRDWASTIDNIQEWLRGCLGTSSKLPLAYVIREMIDMPDGADPPTGYDSKVDELIWRAPIHDQQGNPTAVFVADRTRVWELLNQLTQGKDCATYMREAQRTRDGRMAFNGLKGHYLGANMVDNIARKAERKLQNSEYKGETQNWNFEKFVKLHKDQHAILEKLATDHDYAGIDPRSKVRHLLDGIKVPTLQHAKAAIYASAAHLNDFDRSVNLIQDLLAETSIWAGDRNVHIAAMQTNRKSGGGSGQAQAQSFGGVQPDMSMQDVYYSSEEYKKLSNAQKLGLKLVREANGRGGGKKTKANKNKGKKRNLKAVTSTETDGDTDTDGDQEEPAAKKKTKKNSNRDNSALSRRT